jgi:calcineurin-like phosphoesterase family protein
MSIYFYSDVHYGHQNIIKYSKRPFSNADEMDAALIANHNSVVKPADVVYCIGDFSFHRDQSRTRSIIHALNGTKFLIRGNHDKYLEDKTLSMFAKVDNYMEIYVPDVDIGKQLIVLFHYSMKVWNKSHHGSWHLFGHSHGSLPDDPNSLSFDVGVDCHGYTPISYNRVKEIMKTKTFKPIDRHGQ